MDPHDEAAALAEEWRAVRRDLLALVEHLPETRAYLATERAGWTLKHELSHLAALDRELLHLLERSGHAAVRAAAAAEDEIRAVDLRRVRGTAMHAMQEMRFIHLPEHLTATGQRAAQALQEHGGDALDRVLHIEGRAEVTVREHVRAALDRARDGIETVRRALP